MARVIPGEPDISTV